jgi:hypothetical protein
MPRSWKRGYLALKRRFCKDPELASVPVSDHDGIDREISGLIVILAGFMRDRQENGNWAFSLNECCDGNLRLRSFPVKAKLEQR